MSRSKVYTASKLRHAPMWKDLRSIWTDVEFVSRWLEIEGLVPDTEENAKVFWTHDIADVRMADTVFVYAEPQDKLRGALIEAGVGLGLGKQVIILGNNPDFGTWQYYNLVQRADSFEHAHKLITGGWNV